VDPVCDHMGPVELWRVRWEGETSGMMMIFFSIVTGPCRRGLGWWSNGCRSWYLGHCFQQGIVQVGLLFKPRCMVALQMVQLLVSRLFDPVLLSIPAPLRWVVIHILLWCCSFPRVYIDPPSSMVLVRGNAAVPRLSNGDDCKVPHCWVYSITYSSLFSLSLVSGASSWLLRCRIFQCISSLRPFTASGIQVHRLCLSNIFFGSSVS
jgi:hypothetical protein